MNKAAQTLGRLGGRAKSPAKTRANRAKIRKYWATVKAAREEGVSKVWTGEERLAYRRNYYAENRYKILTRLRNRTPAQKARATERARLWRLANPETVRRVHKEQRSKHRAKRIAYSAMWHAAHRDDAAYKAANKANGLEYYRLNSESRKAYQKHYRKTFSEKYKAMKRAYYLNNKAVLSQKAKGRYKKNPEISKARTKAWCKANPERAYALARHTKSVRRAREKTTPEEAGRIKLFIQRHLSKRNHTCYYCNSQFTGTFHVDHIVALKRNGKHAADNLCIACPQCNLTKNAKPVAELQLKQPLLLET